MKRLSGLLCLIIAISLFPSCKRANKDLYSKTYNLTKKYYEEALEYSMTNIAARQYEYSGTNNLDKIYLQTCDNAKIINKASKNSKNNSQNTNHKTISFSTTTNNKVLILISLFYNTSLNGKGIYLKEKDGQYIKEKLNGKEFGKVLEMQGLNSAINLLMNKEELLSYKFSSDEIDEAVLVLTGTSPHSGITDLNNIDQWNNSIFKIKEAINFLNTEYNIKLNFMGHSFLNNNERLSSVITYTLALKLGSKITEDSKFKKTQTKETIYVYTNSVENRGGSIKEELRDCYVKLGEEKITITNENLKQSYVGKINMTKAIMSYNEKKGIIYEITVDNPSFAPACTLKAIEEYLDEINCTQDTKFTLLLKLSRSFDDFSKEYYFSNIEDFNKREEHKNIHIEIIQA